MAIDKRSRSLRLETATGTDLLRVMISKSLNFIFRVTVRPREPFSSQCRHTLSISGRSSHPEPQRAPTASGRPVGQFPLKIVPDLDASHVADDLTVTRHLER
jgi:hypothetical protein